MPASTTPSTTKTFFLVTFTLVLALLLASTSSAQGRTDDGAAKAAPAAVHFGTARAVGIPLPEDLPTDLSKITAKDEVIALLERSYPPLRSAATTLGSADVTQPVPGTEGVTIGGGMMLYIEHQGEHLGQLVAYARGLGVVPPWSL